MKHIVITIPHADCDTRGRTSWPHPCDYAAEHGGRALHRHMLASGLSNVSLMVGNINRVLLDLNRAEAASSPFHMHLDKILKPGDMYIDVHSYPVADLWAQIWGPYDLVFCAYKGINEKSSAELCNALGRYGIRCKLQFIDTLPVMRDYYLIQKFGPRAKPAIMIELNESASPSRREYVMAVLARWMKNLHG